ncbi:related to Trafficking protein particle complex subunit 20 [Saccharomycodes ludwigii]|uniref:Related to Trafficking protein particle complex subunit 20 n=1 Tax=Saccharomycodes ludwigii TaxID=36035 RepID=A0A376B975_9ASCO|nr:hypothetical protein SCDLUD_002477 [Saccharomycodes ludwigii]KAH3901012.1 hypothetical protein SCDLUD_002477 [Saccharomycodes ludwigii]SSD61171.1 related to Trafficking protein particle complex subunit 20 [Saccharomycodes ludwigii]
MSSAQYFVIIANDQDTPLYEAQLSSTSSNSVTELYPFIANSALDIIEDLQWRTNSSSSSFSSSSSTGFPISFGNDNGFNGIGNPGNTGGSSSPSLFFGAKQNNNSKDLLGASYLGFIDHYYQSPISAYITFGNTKFILIHSSNMPINGNNIKVFYQLVHELYLKTLMNPFYINGSAINSPMFDAKVRAFAAKYLI